MIIWLPVSRLPAGFKFTPDYWLVEAGIELPAPPDGARAHHGLRQHRARRWRRDNEDAASVLLGAVEAITRFPCYVMEHPGAPMHTGRGKKPSFHFARPLRIRSYALSRELADAAGAEIRRFGFPLWAGVVVERYVDRGAAIDVAAGK